MATEIVLGDTRPYVIHLTYNGTPFVINPVSDTVKAAIVKSDRKSALTENPTTCLSTAPGSDWSTSKIVVQFERSDTSALTAQGSAFLEIQVTFSDSMDWTFWVPVTLIKGNI